MKKIISGGEIKKVTTIFLIIFAICILFTGNISQANNCGDTSFTFYFNAGKQNTYVASKGRNKEDYSSTYITCNYAYEPYVDGSLKFTAQVHGSNNASSGFVACSYKGYSTPAYVIYKNTTKYMTNYVKEAKKKYANINVKKNGASATFGGFWSPDNYNMY